MCIEIFVSVRTNILYCLFCQEYIYCNIFFHGNRYIMFVPMLHYRIYSNKIRVMGGHLGNIIELYNSSVCWSSGDSSTTVGRVLLVVVESMGVLVI